MATTLTNQAFITSTSWKICDGFSGIWGDQLIHFNRIRMMNIFGRPKEILEFVYGGAFQEDKVWFYRARLAKGIGIIEENYCEMENYT